MKKKVRIYKALDGQGAVINKTSKFLKKAQEGGMPDVNQMGYPGEQAGQEQMTQDQLAQTIISDISNGRPKEETVIRLVSIFGQEPVIADQYYEQVYNALRSQQESEEEEADDESPFKPIQEDIEEEQAIEESFGYPDENEILSNEIATEDEEEDYSDDEAAAELIMQFGGVSPVIVPMRQDGGEAYPIQFPGIEAYLPFNMNEMLSGDTDPLTGQAWSPQVEEQAAVASDDEAQADFRKGGQYKKDKRVYVNSMLKLTKKQMGGEDVSKKGDADPRGEDVRKERLNAFLGTIKNESTLAKAKEQAEQQFDQMMQQQQQQMQMPQQIPMEQPMAQFGMQIGRGLFGRPKMPRGVGYGYGAPISKIDVRRTGIFGRPKEYSIEFGASPMPGMPGSGAGFYGYGQTTKKTTKSKGRIITETIAGTVNNEAIKEVADKTNSNAASTSAQNNDKDNNGIPDTIQANPIQPEKTIFDSWITDPNATAPQQLAPGSGVLSNNPITPNTTANNVQQNTATSNKRKSVNVNNEADDAVVNNSNEKREETKKYFTRDELGVSGDDIRFNKNRRDAGYIIKDGNYYIDPNYSNVDVAGEKYYVVTDPGRMEQIKKFKPSQALWDQGLKGKEQKYGRDAFGKWDYYDDKTKKYKPVTNPESLKRLENKENISNSAITLKDKPGYYYRFRNDGSFVKFKGDPNNHNADKKPIEVITKKDKKKWDYINNTPSEEYDLKFGKDPNKKKSSKYIKPGTSAYNAMTPDQRNANTMINVRESFGYQEGGVINNPMQDPFGDLQRFVYGGNEYFTQEDIDDVYSKDTSDPYFQYGGLTTYQNKGEVKEDDYDKYQREKAEKEALEEYNSYMNRGEGDTKKMVSYKGNPNDAIYNKILGQTRKKYNIADPNEQPKSANTTSTIKKKTTTTTSNKQNNPYANIGYNGYNAFGNLFPANIASYQGSWGKVKKGPYNKATGAMMPGMGFGPNSQVRSIDVTKSGMFGRPKKYTINYGNQEMDPRKQNLITLPGKESSDANTNAEQNTNAAGTFSNTKGLKAGSRAKVAMKELFNRYNDQEEIPTGDVASTSNAPSPTEKPLSDEEEVAKFQHQQRKNGKRWDEAKQAWVNAEQIRMDLKKPSLLGPSESLTRAKYEEAIKAQGSKADQNRPIGNAAYEERNRRISPSKEKLNKLYSRDLMEQQYGGGLHRFVGGGDSPVTYTDNPALVGMSNVDMISLNEGIPGLQQSSFWGDQASFNKETPVNTQKQPEQIKTDPTQISSDQAKKAYQATPGNFSIDVKNKNMYEVDPEAALATANAGIRGVTGILDRFKNKKSEAKVYDNLTADNLYAADPSRDAGDYDVNTGLYRPNEQGAVHTSRSAQYGGNANYSEGDVIDMTEEELEEFLANGGEVEYLNY
jgi:hypothetical protein